MTKLLNKNVNNFINSVSNNLNNVVTNNNTKQTNLFINIIKLIIVVIVSLVLLYFILVYVFNFDILVWLGFKKQITTTTHNPKKGKQVFNIKSNVFEYKDAEKVCRKYNAELASVEQLIESFKQGAHWCNYGWSKDQLALFPIQKENWKKQKDNNEEVCGEPGINGGYFKDKKLKFGVNCYGKKPRPKYDEIIKDKDKHKDKDKNKNKIKIKIDLNEIRISPFNKDKWSEYQ